MLFEEIKGHVSVPREGPSSLLLQDNLADLYTVSRLKGHSTIRTTERYYVDLLDENYRVSVSGLDSIISDQ